MVDIFVDKSFDNELFATICWLVLLHFLPFFVLLELILIICRLCGYVWWLAAAILSLMVASRTILSGF